MRLQDADPNPSSNTLKLPGNRKARRAMVSILRRNARRRARYERRVKKILLEAIRRANHE